MFVLGVVIGEEAARAFFAGLTSTSILLPLLGGMAGIALWRWTRPIFR